MAAVLVAVAIGAFWFRSAARSILSDSAAGVAAGRLPPSALVGNPAILTRDMRGGAALPGMLASGFSISSGEFYFREPGVTFRIRLKGKEDLLCLVQRSAAWAIFCADISKETFEG